MLEAIEQRPELQTRLLAWWQTLTQTLDGATLLADYGFSTRSAFISEFAERLRQKILPATPETLDASELFSMVMSHGFDSQWLTALDEVTLSRITQLLSLTPDAVTHPTQLMHPTHWQQTVLEALTMSISQVRAAGFASELRMRMSSSSRELAPFHALVSDFENVRDSFLASLSGKSTASEGGDALENNVRQLRERLEACRAAAASVYTHLDEHGISVSLVFRIRQLRERILRIRLLLDCLLSGTPAISTARLLAQLVMVGQERRSLRTLLASNSSLLAAKVTERSSEVGEYYITRNRSEYINMLRKAAGGGAVTAITTLLKFAVMGLGLSIFWNGFWSGLAYAASFIVIQLLHFTLATKQPAMTAPAMAAKLKDLGEDTGISSPQSVSSQPMNASRGALDAFVDEVTHLVRSQAAAVLGNVGVVFPVVLVISGLFLLLGGQPMIDIKDAHYVLHSLSLLGPTVLFAAFTGVLLFVSSLVAGWAENWFVLHHLDSAIRYNPRFTEVLGTERAARWASFMRNNISGLASNVSLGFMLGLIPAFAAFFGLGLEVRHVTLSAGQLAAACAALGWDVVREPALWWSLWWCLAALPLIGLLNLGVSFYLAFRLALRAHNVGDVERDRIRQAIWQRMLGQPLSFLWPTRTNAIDSDKDTDIEIKK